MFRGDRIRGAAPKLAPGTNVCFCTTCGELFKSVGGFDKHRRADPFRCLTTAEMREKGMALNEHGQWVTAAYADWRGDNAELAGPSHDG